MAVPKDISEANRIMVIKENILIEAIGKSGNDEFQKSFLDWQQARNTKNEAFANFIINLTKS